MAEIKVKEIKTIPEGRQEATIVSVIRRSPDTDKTAKFDYTDYNLRLDNVDGQPTIKYGVPTDISVDQNGEPRTKHAKLLKVLGIKLEGSINTDKVIGMRVSCLIKNEENEKGSFAGVVDGTVKKI